jgi:hypothetical protein
LRDVRRAGSVELTVSAVHRDGRQSRRASEAVERTAFTCGQIDLDEWLRHRASQDEKRNLARIFVASDDDGVVDFYSM